MSFEPKIVAYVCNWCTYLGADLAGTNRLEYPPNVRIIRLPCTGRIDFNLLVKAFEMRADAVLVSGCHPGDCHYTAGNYHARRRWMLFRPLLEILGFDLRRIHFTWISAAEGRKFQQVVTEITEHTRALGPYEYLGWRERAALPPPPAPSPDDGFDYRESEGRVRETARELLASGAVRVVIGYSGDGRPLFVFTAEDVQKLAWNANSNLNLTAYLKRKEIQRLGKPAIVINDAGARTLNVLKIENQVEDEAYVAIRVEAPPKKRHSAELEALLAMPSQERMAYWMGEFDRCTKCYACRQVCPLCYCERCIVDKNRPQAIATSAHAEGNYAWHIARAFHLAARCTGCGNCAAACPSGINLKLLNMTLANAALDRFGYRPGADPNAQPVLGCYSLQDKESFIR